MTKRKSPGIPLRFPADNLPGRADKRAGEASSTDAVHRHLPSQAAIRETIESIVIAFVLAFLFRTFEAEAFVIPTGSMAPTLMGRHKDLDCPKCGSPYQVSASDEVDNDGALQGAQLQTTAGTCPMCRYTADLAPDNPQHMKYPSYNGDRILVGKFAYELGDPQRWDVIVFKFPGDATTDARTNFIKRLVALPGETIRVQHGDLWIRRGEEPFEIARKPAEKLLAMLQPVFDNDYMAKIAELGWPARWQPERPAGGNTAGAWTSDDFTTFRTDGTAEGISWLRYQHLVPSYSQWKALEERQGQASPPSLTPQLITDFTAYNTRRDRRGGNPAMDMDSLGVHWVGDLALSCTVGVESSRGELLFELRKGGRRFECRIDVATGEATLSISGPDMEQFRPTASTCVRGPGRHEIRFSNCDDELRLWVDGSVVTFSSPTTYADLGNTLPDAADLTPVGVASAGAQVQVSHLNIERDIYYSAVRGDGMPTQNGDVQFMSGHPLPNEGKKLPGPDYVDFALGPDRFFALGDNSTRSKDSRLWGQDNYWVPRELLIGKALFIYWPHSWDKIPYTNVPCPYFPNVARMGLVR